MDPVFAPALFLGAAVLLLAAAGGLVALGAHFEGRAGRAELALERRERERAEADRNQARAVVEELRQRAGRRRRGAQEDADHDAELDRRLAGAPDLDAAVGGLFGLLREREARARLPGPPAGAGAARAPDATDAGRGP